ncbi:MAG TPA: hypothetical protein DCW60_03805 [Sutterella sp.]|nr:hypothetical protein [Sutterella sp.]
MKKLLSFCLVALFCAQAAVAVTDPAEKRVQNLVKQKMSVEAASVKKTPFGLYEVVIGRQPVYVDADVKFVISGHVFDVVTQKDLTQARIDELSFINIGDLPLKQALVTKKGNGSHVLYHFADPYCSFCKQLEKTLVTLDNVTIYSFVSPVLDSQEMVARILSADNPQKAWRDWMLRAKEPPKAKTKAGNDWMKANENLVNRLSIDAVPLLFFKDGLRLEGAVSKDEIEAKFKTLYP